MSIDDFGKIEFEELDMFGDEPVEPPKKPWEEEWQDMPEFVQTLQKPYAQIIFRFDNEDALQDFAKLIGQKLTSRTKSAWHPEIIRGLHCGNKRYVDES